MELPMTNQSEILTEADLIPASDSPSLSLAEINTMGLVTLHTDPSGQPIASLLRDGRELDLDGLGHFMDLVQEARGPWVVPASNEGSAPEPAKSWRQILGHATVLQGDEAQAVQSAVESLTTLQASLPALIERLREAVGEYEAQNQSKSLSNMFRAR